MSSRACIDSLHKGASRGREQTFRKLVWLMYQNYWRRHIKYSKTVQLKVHIGMPSFAQFSATVKYHGYVLGSVKFTIRQLLDRICGMHRYSHLPDDVLANVSSLVGWDTIWAAVLFCPTLSGKYVWASSEFLSTSCTWHIGSKDPLRGTWWQPRDYIRGSKSSTATRSKSHQEGSIIVID